MPVAWPPRLRFPRSAFAVLASVCDQWSLEELADSQCQQRALTQLCAEIPLLRALLDAATRALRQEGAVLIKRVPTSDTALIIATSALGVVTAAGNGYPGRLIWDVRPNPTAPGSVRSQLRDAFPLHTDSAHEDRPHAVVGLACVEPSQDGDGLSLLVPASRVVGMLRTDNREREVRLLQHPCFPFANASEDGRPVRLHPILRLANGEVRVRYREPLIHFGIQSTPRSLDAEHRTALETFQATLGRPSLPTPLRLQANDLLLFDNRRVLHGRSKISPASNRHLKRLKLHELNAS